MKTTGRMITAVLIMVCSAKLLFAQNTVPRNSKDARPSLKDTTRAAEYFNKGKEFAEGAQFDSSNTYYEKARKIYQKLGNLYALEPMWEKALQSSNSMGWNFMILGKYDDALECLNEALGVGLEKFGKNHVDVAESYNIIGVVYGNMGDYDRTVEYLLKSLSVRLALFGEEHPKVAGSYNNIGMLYQVRGDYDRALEYHQKSLSIRLSLLDKGHPDVAASYVNIGNVYYGRGDYDRAIEYYQENLTINLRSFGEEHPNVAGIYSHIGNAYHQKRAYDKAIEYHLKSISIKLGLFGEEHPHVAESYDAAGNVYSANGDHDRALEYYQKSLSIYLRSPGEEQPYVAFVHNNIGELYNKKGDYDRAIEYHRKALAMELKVFGKFHPAVADCYRDLAEVYFHKGHFSKALTYCQRSIRSVVSGFDEPSIYSNPPLEDISSEIYLLDALALKAEVFARLSDPSGARDLEMAFTTYQLAAGLIDKMRIGYKAEGSRLFLGGKAVETYEKAVETALRLYQTTADEVYKAAAFRFAEKGKAIVLSQALQESRAKAFAGIPERVLEKERQLRIDLTFYETQLQKERQKKANQDESRIRDFQSRYFSLNAEYQSLIEELEKTYPRYYDLKYESKTVSITELQERLDTQTTVVEYFTGERSIYVFTVAKSHFAVTTVAKDTLFEADIEQLRDGIERHDSQLYVRSSQRLYRSLISPVRDHLKTKSLIIIPDHVIAHIPFEALLADDDTDARTQDYAGLPYLLRKYEISYAYSATLLLELLNQDTPEPPQDYLAFAPVFPDGFVAGSRAAVLLRANLAVDSSRAARTHLPASRDEVEGIQKLFRQSYGFLDRLSDWLLGNKTSVYLESQADEENLKKIMLKNYRYIHFATHGFANKTTPDLSGLLLAHDPSSAEDGVLFLGEVYNLELNADLVTLSACESGIGKSVKGEGLLSLSRGFLYAGAKNLLVSLWKADDQATSELMLAFYQELLKGKSKAEALRDAKLQLMEREWQKSEPRHLGTEYADPSCWASFILVGK